MIKRTFLKTLLVWIAGCFLPKQSQSEDLSLESLNKVFAEIEAHDLKVAKILVHPDIYKETFKDLKKFNAEWQGEFFDTATKKEVLQSGLYGHLFTADIHMSPPRKPREICPVCGLDDLITHIHNGNKHCCSCGSEFQMKVSVS